MLKLNTVKEILNELSGDKYYRGPQSVDFEDFYITIEDLKTLVETQVIDYDIKNRQSDFINDEKTIIVPSHVHEIAEDFFAPALGMASVVAVRNGEKHTLKFADFHNRSYSIAEFAIKHPTQWEVVKHTPLLLRVVREGLGGKMNAKINTQKAHTSRNKLLNVNLAFGDIIISTYNQVADFKSELPKATWLQQLANGIYAKAFDILTPEMTFQKFWSLKGATRKLFNAQRGKKIFPNWNKTIDLPEIIVAVRAALEVMVLMRKRWSSNRADGVINKDLERLSASAFWFGFWFLDALTTRQLISKYDDEMADKIERKGSEFVDLILNLNEPEKEKKIRALLGVPLDPYKKSTKSTKGSKLYKEVAKQVEEKNTPKV